MPQEEAQPGALVQAEKESSLPPSQEGDLSTMSSALESGDVKEPVSGEAKAPLAVSESGLKDVNGSAESKEIGRQSGEASAGDANIEPSFEIVRETNQVAADALVLAQSRHHTRRAFLVGGAAAAAGYGFYRFLGVGPQRDMLPAALDSAYRFNAQASEALLAREPMAPTYPLSKAKELRVNGVFGLKKTLEPESYRLQVVGVKDAAKRAGFVADVTAWEYRYRSEGTKENPGHDNKTDPKMLTSAKMPLESVRDETNKREERMERPERGTEEAGESDSTLDPGTPGLLLQLEDFLPRLQRHELVTQFKCIEGWSEVVQWSGVRLRDFIELFPPEPIDGKDPKYVYMETPDGDYYVGYDLEICRHPQALLVTEMTGKPLTQFHGAPLRVHMPFKYGYKQIKRIGLIAYTNDKPDDYWTKLGYDWYGGL